MARYKCYLLTYLLSVAFIQLGLPSWSKRWTVMVASQLSPTWFVTKKTIRLNVFLNCYVTYRGMASEIINKPCRVWDERPCHSRGGLNGRCEQLLWVWPCERCASIAAQTSRTPVLTNFLQPVTRKCIPRHLWFIIDMGPYVTAYDAIESALIGSLNARENPTQNTSALLISSTLSQVDGES